MRRWSNWFGCLERYLSSQLTKDICTLFMHNNFRILYLYSISIYGNKIWLKSESSTWLALTLAPESKGSPQVYLGGELVKELIREPVSWLCVMTPRGSHGCESQGPVYCGLPPKQRSVISGGTYNLLRLVLRSSPARDRDPVIRQWLSKYSPRTLVMFFLYLSVFLQLLR